MCNLSKTKPMSEIKMFTSKCSNFDVSFRIGAKNFENFFVSSIVSFELVAVNSHYF